MEKKLPINFLRINQFFVDYIFYIVSYVEFFLPKTLTNESIQFYYFFIIISQFL